MKAAAPRPRVLLLVEQRHWFAAASLPPLLRKAGTHVDVICRPGSLVAKSRYVDRAVLVDGPQDTYFAAVRDYLAANRSSYISVIPVTDTDVRGLAMRADEAWVHGIFPAHRTREVIDALLGKPAMDALLVRAGVPLPASVPIATAEDLVAFGNTVGWPVMLKPADGVGGGGVARVHSPDDVVAAIARVADSYTLLMAQALVPGPVASCQVVFDRGRPLAWATSYKVRTWPGPYGPSSAIAYAEIPGVAEQLPAIGSALGFHGALTIDFIVDERSGQPMIIEVNARPAGIMGRGQRGGVDFAAALRQMWLGIEAQTHLRGTRRNATAGLYPQDLVRAVDERELAPLRDWLAAANLADLPWTDPMVFLASTRFLLSHLLRRA